MFKTDNFIEETNLPFTLNRVEYMTKDALKTQILTYANESFEQAIKDSSFDYHEKIQALRNHYNKPLNEWTERSPAPYSIGGEKVPLRLWLRDNHDIVVEWSSLRPVAQKATQIFRNKIVHLHGEIKLHHLDGYDIITSNGFICKKQVIKLVLDPVTSEPSEEHFRRIVLSEH